MGPYLAVIGDSFRAAFSSRVLWVAIAAIYLFLFSIAPFGYREVMTTSFRAFDLSNGTRMKAMLAQDIDESKRTPPGMIARALPEELQANLRKVAEGQEVRIRLDLLADGLTELLERDDWYDADVWKKTVRLRELRELEEIPASDQSEDERRRISRLRIEAALPGVFQSRSARSLSLTYAGFDFPAVFQIDPSQFKLLLNHFVLRIIIDWILGFVMIFLGILVTASIIPDMLQPGSLHLLLSKPIKRSWLFLAKFLGGCAFVMVCVTQLIVGLWLICGWRLDVWNARLLWCIPVCVFLFAVFYSVSAVAGLRWRSPILSIGLANAFGALCLIVGIAGGVSDGFITEPDRIESMAVSGDTVIAATRGAKLKRFDVTTNRWVDLFPDNRGGGDMILPPVTLADGRIITARVRSGRMNLFGSGSTSSLLLDRSVAWTPIPSIELPTSTTHLFTTPQGELLALNSSELMLASGGLLRPIDEPSASDGKNTSEAAKPTPNALFSKLMKMMGGASDGFRSIIPNSVSLSTPRSVAVAPSGDTVFVYSGGTLSRLDRQAPDTPTTQWKVAATKSLGLETKASWFRMIGDDLVLLRSDSPPMFFDASLEPLTNIELIKFDFGDFKISDVVTCTGTSEVAIVTTDGLAFTLGLGDQASATMTPLSGLSEVDALSWDAAPRQLFCSHHIDQVAAVDLASHRVASTIKPSIAGWRLVDRYAVTPLRTVTPQTGELGDTIAAIVSGESALELPMMAEAPPVRRYHVWRPVVTCAVFIAVMLTIGCVYFARTDF